MGGTKSFSKNRKETAKKIEESLKFGIPDNHDRSKPADTEPISIKTSVVSSLSEKLFAEPENVRSPKVSDSASKSRKKSPSFDKQSGAQKVKKSLVALIKNTFDWNAKKTLKKDSPKVPRAPKVPLRSKKRSLESTTEKKKDRKLT